VAEYGTHNDLMRIENGVYSELVKLQFGGMLDEKEGKESS